MKRILLVVLCWFIATTDTDGQSPVLVKDIYSDSMSAIDPQTPLVVYKNKLYFSAMSSENNIELWSTDGTEVNTKLFIDINPNGNTYIENLLVFNNKLLFTISTYQDILFFSSDGSSENTSPYMWLHPNDCDIPIRFFEFNNSLYFLELRDYSKLFQTDGATYVRHISPHIFAYTSRLAIVNNRIFFSGYNTLNPEEGIELYSTDGTTTDIGLFKDINIGDKMSMPEYFAQLSGGKFLFTADDGVHGAEPWISDGTPEGTRLFADINPGIKSSWPTGYFEMNGLVFFFATGENGQEPWVTDGSYQGTHMIKDISPGGGDGVFLPGYVRVNNRILFAAGNEEYGRELWTTDGTEAGTYMIKDIGANGFSGINQIRAENVIGNKLYFGGKDDNGIEPWVTDGTTDGTYMIYDLNPGSASSLGYISNFKEWAGKVFFVANNGKTGFELWRIDMPLSKNEPVSAKQVKVYPNPTSGTVMVQTNGKVLQAEVYNAIGQLVQKEVINNSSLTLRSKIPGIYYLRLRDNEGYLHQERLVLTD